MAAASGTNVDGHGRVPQRKRLYNPEQQSWYFNDDSSSAMLGHNQTFTGGLKQTPPLHYYEQVADRFAFPYPRRSPNPSTAAPHQGSKFFSMASQDEIEALQRASERYQPEIEGPLVGDRQSSQALTSEFSTADRVYIQKTQALAETFSEYRQLKGDGHCGWRAVAFSYCETLLQNASSPAKVLEEVTRIKSLNNLLASVGTPMDLCEDYVDETLDLLNELSNKLDNPSDDSFLLAAFNDLGRSSAIITHIKLLASAYMKSHASDYEPFLSGQSVAEYCAQQIDPVQVEMEHMGLNALVEVLVKPAGFAVEVSYLDRSEGSEMNTHRFDASDPDAPTLRLLYRPGHYDILYKRATVVNYMVSRFDGGFTPNAISPFSSTSHNLLGWLNVPGSSLAGPLPPIPSYPRKPSSKRKAPKEEQPAKRKALADELPRPPVKIAEDSKLKIRPSEYERPEIHPDQPSPLPLTTPLKNSPFNPAHFGNMDFQPEIWVPESERPKKSE